MKTKLFVATLAILFVVTILAVGPSTVIPFTYSENDATGDQFFFCPSGMKVKSITVRNHDTTDTVAIIPKSYTALVDPDWAEQTVTAPTVVVQRGCTGSAPTTGIMTLTAVAPIDSRAKYWRKISPVTFTNIAYAGVSSVTITASANYFKAGDYIYVTAGDAASSGGTIVYNATVGKRLYVSAVDAATTTITATTATGACTGGSGHSVTSTTGSLSLDAVLDIDKYKYAMIVDTSSGATFALKYPNLVIADHQAYYISDDSAITSGQTDYKCVWPMPLTLGPVTAGADYSSVTNFPIDLEDGDGLYVDASGAGATIIDGYITLE